jgi:hypothetical protein
MCLDVEGSKNPFHQPGVVNTRPQITDCNAGDDPAGVDVFLTPAPGKTGQISWGKYPDYCLTVKGEFTAQMLEFALCYEQEPHLIQFTMPEGREGQIVNAAFPEECVSIIAGNGTEQAGIDEVGFFLHQAKCSNSTTAVSFTIMEEGKRPNGTAGRTPVIEMEVATFFLDASGLNSELLNGHPSEFSPLKEKIALDMAAALPGETEPEDIKVRWLTRPAVTDWPNIPGCRIELALRPHMNTTAEALQTELNTALYSEQPSPRMINASNAMRHFDGIGAVSTGIPVIESVERGETRKERRAMLLPAVNPCAPAAQNRTMVEEALPPEMQPKSGAERTTTASSRLLLAYSLATISFALCT